MGTFPSRWKLSWIIPLLKSTDIDKLSHSAYCPVSQLPVLSKLTEKALQHQFLQFLEQTNQLSASHHAHCEHLSTTTAVVHIMDIISTAMDENKFTATLSLDQMAVFDCINHRLLIEKLRYYNLNENCLNWITSYLSHRTNYVSIGSANSYMTTQEFGVPQGSVLGSLLYLLYVNELAMTIINENCLNEVHKDDKKLFGNECEECGQIPTFADNVVYLVASRDRFSNQLAIENRFIKIKNFLSLNGLQAMAEKTKLMWVHVHTKVHEKFGNPARTDGDNCRKWKVVSQKHHRHTTVQDIRC